MAGPFTAGQKITAAQLNAFCVPLAVIKPGDQSLASSTTLQNDSALFVPVVASATYLFDCYLDYEGGTLGSSDLKWTWAVPAGAALRYCADWLSTGSTVQVGITHKDTDVLAAGTGGAASLFSVRMTGSLVMGVTAGNLQLQWAQNTSNATATIVHAQSRLALWRVT